MSFLGEIFKRNKKKKDQNQSDLITKRQEIREPVVLNDRVKEQLNLNTNKEPVPDPTTQAKPREIRLNTQFENNLRSNSNRSQSKGNKNSPMAKVKTPRELMENNTHYVFVFGYIGSGKSTVLGALNYFLRKKYEIIQNPDNKEGIVLINRLVAWLENGMFPDGTNKGVLTEYEVCVEHDYKHRMNLTFIEMGGEDLKKASANFDEDLPPFIIPYLSTEALSISFVLVVDYDNVVGLSNLSIDEQLKRNQDNLMSEFLDILIQNNSNTDHVALIISKYDRSKISEDSNLEELLKTKLPRTFKKLSNRDRFPNSRIFPFSVGDVSLGLGENGKDKITALNLNDCKKILHWLVGNLDTRRSPKGVIKKFLDSLK